MIKHLFIIVFLFLGVKTVAQIEVLPLNKTVILKINFNEKKFYIQDVKIDSNKSSNSVNINNNTLYMGSVSLRNKLIILHNNKKLVLKKISQFTYIAENEFPYIKRNTILRTFTYESKDRSLIIKNMRWNKGTRDGSWLFIDYKNKMNYLIRYKQGVVVDSVPTNTDNAVMYR